MADSYVVTLQVERKDDQGNLTLLHETLQTVIEFPNPTLATDFLYCLAGPMVEELLLQDPHLGDLAINKAEYGCFDTALDNPPSEICPRCGISDTDVTTIHDHDMCRECLHLWQMGELPEQQEDAEVTDGGDERSA